MSGSTWRAVGMVCVVACSAAAAGEGIPVASRLDAVTLYRGQALVTRVVTLPAKNGELELIVADLPARVVPASLSLSAGDGVTVRAVRYRARAVAAAAKKEVAAMDARLKQLEAEKYANDQAARLLDTRDRHLDKLESFGASAASAEMGKGALNFETLTKVSEYITKRREQVSRDRVVLRARQTDLADRLALAKRKRAELARGSSRTVREAVLFISKADPAGAAARLTYLVNSATWTPTYNIRLARDGRRLNVEYLAQVSQTTGEDWAGVKLTLSTATPAMNAQNPLLVPMWIALTATPRGGKGKVTSTSSLAFYVGGQRKLYGGQAAALERWNTLGTTGGGFAGNWDLIANAAEQQRMELNVKEKLFRAGRDAIRAQGAGLAVSYAMDGKIDLASRRDRQLLRIADLKFTGRTHYLAIPLLGSYVYRNSRATNDGKVPLLAGAYSAYVDGEFVGRGRLPVVARGQDFTVGFGADPQLRCRRELLDKTDRISWGSRVQKFEYRLRLENFKPTAVRVRLIDRVPASKDDEQIRIQLGRVSEALSADPVYVRDDKDRGILRWDIALAANAAGAKARHVSYTFEMKYAKDAHVGREAAGLMDQMKEDLEKALAQ